MRRRTRTTKSRMPMQMDTKDDGKMENQKVEPSPIQRAIFETNQNKTQLQDNKTLQDNKDITKHYKTGFVLMLILS